MANGASCIHNSHSLPPNTKPTPPSLGHAWPQQELKVFVKSVPNCRFSTKLISATYHLLFLAQDILRLLRVMFLEHCGANSE